MKIISVLIAALALCRGASPVMTNLVIEFISHSSVQVRFLTNEAGASTAVRINYGETPALGFQTFTNTNGTPTALTRGVSVGGLAPNTRYYFRPVASDNAGVFNTSWVCPSAGVFTGYTCDNPGDLPYFTTTALPAVHPEPPAGITRVDTAMPVINGGTFTVSVNGNNRCTDFGAALSACALADTSLNHQVLIPAGASCVGSFQLPAKTGPGTCVVRTSTPDALLPPAGVRIRPSYLPLMASLVSSKAQMGQASGRESLRTAPTCAAAVCTEGWRFVGLHFTTEAHDSSAPVPLQITQVSGYNITVSAPHNLQIYSQIYVADVQGMTGINGVTRVYASLSPTQFRIFGSPTGTYQPGTGYVLQTNSVPLHSCNAATPVICTTTTQHGLSNQPDISITSASGNVLAVPAGHGIPNGLRVIEIRGSSIAAYNRIWKISASGTNSVTLSPGPTGSPSCSSDCGTLRLKYSLEVFQAAGGNVNGSRIYSVINATTVQLDQTDGSAGPASGGFITQDPDMYFNLVRFNKGSSRMVVDRCYVQGRGFPDRLYGGISMSSDNSAFIDSYLEGINAWRPINPVTNLFEGGYAGTLIAVSVPIDLTTGSHKKISNNTITDSVGISFFITDADVVSNSTPSNIEITRNTISSSERFRAGSPESDGRYYSKRHLMEFKRGRRMLIAGNLFSGNWADAVPLGPSLLFSPRGNATLTDNLVSDADVANNVFEKTAGAIHIEGTDNYKDHSVSPTRRIRIRNNLFHDVNYYKYRSSPSITGGAVVPPFFGGYAILTSGSVEDMEVSHNTAFNRGTFPKFFYYNGGRSEGVRVTNNLYTHNDDTGYGGITKANEITGLAPAFTGTPQSVFQQYFTWGSAPDPTSRFSDNVVIPGVKNSSAEGGFENTAAAANYTKSDCQTFYAGFNRIRCVGSGAINETANDRISMAKLQDVPRTNYRLRHDTPYGSGGASPASGGRDVGVDMEELDSARGVVKNARILLVSDTAATVAYLAPDQAACHIDYDASSLFTTLTRVSDNGGNRPRRVPLSNLTPGTLYYYRIQCAAEQPSGTFVTRR